MTEFHFLRPLWLLGVIPAGVLLFALWFVRVRFTGWRKAINGTLLPHLLDSAAGKRQGWPMFFILLAWLMSCISLAGPTWEKLPQPVQKKENALVIIQDLSLSMYAKDLSPNRISRSQHKLVDLLKQRKEGTTALVVYSGDAHVVSPLTDDSNTIASMVPSLSPGIMPSYGSNVVAAVKMALQLLKDAGVSRGRILLVTDEVDEADADEVSKVLQGKNVEFLVLGVGTADGGPIPKNDGGFWKDSTGNIIVPRLNRDVLKKLARRNNGRYIDIQLDDHDIEYLLAAGSLIPEKDEYRQIDRDFDQWKEMGPWLLLPVLPVLLLAFRKGWLLVFILVLSCWTSESNAMTWQDLWQRKDQQAAKALNSDDPATAAKLFKTPSWKGVAEYQSKDFSAAAETFGQNETADSYYNKGNALAKAGNFEEALKAYDKALQLNPDMKDAQFNKELLEQLKQQQEKQKNKGQDQNSGDRQEQKSNNQQDDKGQNSQDKGQDQQGNTNQDQDKQQQGKQAGKQQNEQASQADNQQAEQGQKNDDENNAGEQQEQQMKQGQETADNESAQDKNKQAAGDAGEKDADDQQKENAIQSADKGKMTNEEKQAMEQWLRQVPDDPGGLLRRKFEYESRLNQGHRSSKENRKIW